MNVVWWQLLHSEAARARNLCNIIALEDIVKCYEHVEHTILAKHAGLVPFRVWAIRFAVTAYKWARVSRKVFPSRGVVAGQDVA